MSSDSFSLRAYLYLYKIGNMIQGNGEKSEKYFQYVLKTLTYVEDDFQLFGEYLDSLLSGSVKKYSSSEKKTKHVIKLLISLAIKECSNTLSHSDNNAPLNYYHTRYVTTIN
jgi:hypothetical protein